jgi:peptide/nickel transport system permease protein
VRYWYWLSGVLHGDLGDSVRIQKPVMELILEKLPVTIQLALMAMLIALAIGITAGVISAVKKDTWLDYAANVFALWGLSTPNFWLGILLILLFRGAARLVARVRLRQSRSRISRRTLRR